MVYILIVFVCNPLESLMEVAPPQYSVFVKQSHDPLPKLPRHLNKQTKHVCIPVGNLVVLLWGFRCTKNRNSCIQSKSSSEHFCLSKTDKKQTNKQKTINFLPCACTHAHKHSPLLFLSHTRATANCQMSQIIRSNSLMEHSELKGRPGAWPVAELQVCKT